MATQTVTGSSGVSASGLRQETLVKATETMFGKIAEYVKGEVHGKVLVQSLLAAIKIVTLP
jgi:hypothetical protein